MLITSSFVCSHILAKYFCPVSENAPSGENQKVKCKKLIQKQRTQPFRTASQTSIVLRKNILTEQRLRVFRLHRTAPDVALDIIAEDDDIAFASGGKNGQNGGNYSLATL